MKTIVFLTIVINLIIVPDYTHSVIPFRMFKMTDEPLSRPEERMINGLLAKEKQFPFVVCVVVIIPYGDGPFFCTGSLVHRAKVLTAGYCFVLKTIPVKSVILAGGKADLTKYLMVRMQTSPRERLQEYKYGVEERRATAIHRHLAFDGISLANNLAVVVFRKPFSPDKVKIIPLSKSRMLNPMKCTAIGWSLTTDASSILKLHYLSDRQVRTRNSGCKPRLKVQFLCLVTDGSAGGCLGNTGGPLVCDGKLWGVSEFHLSIDEQSNKEPCSKNRPLLYSEVYFAVDWIESISGVSPLPVVTLKNILLLSIFCSAYEKFLVIL